MSKGSNRISLSLAKGWFNSLIETLVQQKERLLYLAPANEDNPSAYHYGADLREVIQLLNGIAKNSVFTENEDGDEVVDLSFTPTESKALIWQLLLFSSHSEEVAFGLSHDKHFDDFQKLHSDYSKGELIFKKPLSFKAAWEMYEWFMCGAVYLVKYKDGTCYFVDHGYTELVKTDDQWVDKKWGAFDPVFIKTKFKYDIVSWEDEEPLDILEYLQENGWVVGNQFVG